MRIEQIEQLIEIVECGSIGKAAQKLYVQQPNLSMLVKNIEDEFHQPIFTARPAASGLRLSERILWPLPSHIISNMSCSKRLAKTV